MLKRALADRERSDYRAALVSSVIANAHRGKDTKAFTPEDFMPRRRPKVQTWQQQLALVEVLNRAFGGRDERPPATEGG